MKIFRSSFCSDCFAAILTTICLLMNQSCTKSQIGEELANSFDTPRESSAPEKPIKELNDKNESRVQKVSVSKTKKNKVLKPERFKKKRMDNFVPQPYRIIIKLSGANPSAPAETVTEALRKAGISFEVERIERFDNQSSIKVISSGRDRL